MNPEPETRQRRASHECAYRALFNRMGDEIHKRIDGVWDTLEAIEHGETTTDEVLENIRKAKMMACSSWDMNLYRYDEILGETDEGIQLLLRDRDEILPKTPWLPKKCIKLFCHLHEVMIPEWLCVRTGLLEEMAA